VVKLWSSRLWSSSAGSGASSSASSSSSSVGKAVSQLRECKTLNLIIFNEMNTEDITMTDLIIFNEMNTEDITMTDKEKKETSQQNCHYIYPFSASTPNSNALAIFHDFPSPKDSSTSPKSPTKKPI
jgi:hypothetical protein